MKRLIAKKINLVEILQEDHALNDIIIKHLLSSRVLKNLLANKHLSSGEIFDKILKSKLTTIVSNTYNELLQNNNIQQLLQQYATNDIKSAIRQHIKDNIRNRGFIYDELHLHIYNIFHSSHDDINDESSDKQIQHDKTNYIDLTNINNFNTLKNTFKNFTTFDNFLLKIIMRVIQNDDAIIQLIHKNKHLEIDELLVKFMNNDITNIAISILNILCNHFSTEKQIFTFNESANSPIIKVIISYINNNRNIQFRIASYFLQVLDSLPEDLRSDKQVKDLQNLTLKEIKELPTLKQMYRINDSINDIHNISLTNYYNAKIVITADLIKFFPNVNDITYINELKQNNTPYAVGTITNDGIVCIHDNNMNIQDIINICKQESSQIKKVYILDKQYNFAAQITRKARLYKRIYHRGNA